MMINKIKVVLMYVVLITVIVCYRGCLTVLYLVDGKVEIILYG